MRFRILTYNIHKAIGVDGKFAPERIVEIIEHYAPDITLLQEVDRHAPRSEMLDLASHIGRQIKHDYRAVGMNVALKKGRYGNATLSRHPIGRQRNIDLTIANLKRRGAQHTRIELHRGHAKASVNIFNIHLSLLARIRQRQITQLFETTDFRELSPDVPCIVAGDMNDWRHLLKKRFSAMGFACATNRHSSSRWSIKTYPSVAPVGGLDKIFFRGPMRVVHVARSRLKLAKTASDHLPVIADFEIEPLRH